MRNNTLIIGSGDIGRRTATLLAGRGDSVSLVGRTVVRPEANPALTTFVQADLDSAESLTCLPLASGRLLYLAPPPSAGEHDTRMENFCSELTRQLPGRPQGVVYASTSGVYGDCGGEWVDETRSINPQSDRARRRVDAENRLRAWGELNRVPVVILRVSGIYGPGRLPLQRLRSGMPILHPEQAPLSNRIHADDLARVCVAALDRVEVGGIFNVCDGEQSSMGDYFLTVARIYGLPEPPQISLAEAKRQFSPEMLSYLVESRRLSNRRMLEDLEVSLLYPTLEEGLLTIRQEEEGRDAPD